MSLFEFELDNNNNNNKYRFRHTLKNKNPMIKILELLEIENEKKLTRNKNVRRISF